MRFDVLEAEVDCVPVSLTLTVTSSVTVNVPAERLGKIVEVPLKPEL